MAVYSAGLHSETVTSHYPLAGGNVRCEKYSTQRDRVDSAVEVIL
jgi:hypothetical protein